MPPHDKGVIDEVKKVGEYSNVARDFNKSLIHIINDEIDHAYLKQLNNLQFLAMVKPKTQKIVFTPLHGTGKMCIRDRGRGLPLLFFSMGKQNKVKMTSKITLPFHD